MSADEPNIVVREVRGEKKVGFRGFQYIDKPESEMREMVEEFGDAIIAFYEADEELDGVEKYWRFGEIIDEFSDGDIENSDLKEMLNYSTLDIAQTYDFKLFHNFYKAFPEGDYDENYPWAMYRDMVVDKRVEMSKRVVNRLQSHLAEGESPRTYEYRAFLKCDSYGLLPIVQSLYDIGEHQTSKLTLDKLIEGARHVRIMAGEDPSIVTKENVKKVVDTLEIINDISEG